MKKILIIIMALVMAVSTIALIACDKAVDYKGEFSKESHGTNYGFEVTVTVKGDKVTAINIMPDDESGLAEATSSEYWPDRAKWDNGKDTFVESLVGMTVAEINAIKASAEDLTVTGVAPVAGATQSSTRLVLAVQNALKSVK